MEQTVRCFPAATNDPLKNKQQLLLSSCQPPYFKRAGGLPKFSMIRFVSDKTKAAGGAEGAVLHFLVEYGLTPEQQQETASLLKKQVKGAILKGAVPLESGQRVTALMWYQLSWATRSLHLRSLQAARPRLWRGSR
jgi:hypothetical protein